MPFCSDTTGVPGGSASPSSAAASAVPLLFTVSSTRPGRTPGGIRSAARRLPGGT
jgi:hypothetical protein